jgi:hypothetical protein
LNVGSKKPTNNKAGSEKGKYFGIHWKKVTHLYEPQRGQYLHGANRVKQHSE